MNSTKLGTIFSYKGIISFEIIEDLLTQFKQYMASVDIDMVVKKRLFAIMVESMENAYRHKINLNGAGKHAPVEFLLKQTETGFEVIIGNYVRNESVPGLINRINQVNGLNLEGLNQLYRSSISSARISEKGGAGLGLIEIARNSRHAIDYIITQENDKISFFQFEIHLSNDPNKTK